jgi:predicted nucleic acid-binding Zn ribbon protein
MPTYTYETIPGTGRAARRFEVRQRMDEPALATDPETGDPVRRVISGGLGLVMHSTSDSAEPESGCGPESCTCGRFS